MSYVNNRYDPQSDSETEKGSSSLRREASPVRACKRLFLFLNQSCEAHIFHLATKELSEIAYNVGTFHT